MVSMIEWYTVIPIIALLVQGLIAIFVAWYGQKRSVQEIEELKHRLIEERFYKEKWWNETKSLYYDISKVCQDTLNCMREISITLSIFEKELHPLTGIYILSRVLDIGWEHIIQWPNATESERLQIKLFDELLHLDRFNKLINRLKDISGQVSIFASEQVNETFNVLLKMSDSFPVHLINELNLLITESSRRTNSPSEYHALEVFNELFLIQMGKESIRSPETLDLGSVITNFSDMIEQMHIRMKEELSKGLIS